MVRDIIQNLELYFPTIHKHMTSARELRDYELMVYCDDDSRFLYDDLDKTIRRLPSSGEDITEDVWRREFGYRLKKIMIRKGLTQQELAERIGTSQVMLSNYMTGRSMPGFYMVDKIARALDCSIDDFRYT